MKFIKTRIAKMSDERIKSKCNTKNIGRSSKYNLSETNINSLKIFRKSAYDLDRKSEDRTAYKMPTLSQKKRKIQLMIEFLSHTINLKMRFAKFADKLLRKTTNVVKIR